MITCLCPNPSVDTLAWVERWTPGNVHRTQREMRFPGGKGVHVAMALTELGMPCRLYGIWGGLTGEWIKAACREKSILCDGIETEGWNRTCLTFKSDSDLDDTELLGCGPEITQAQFEAFLTQVTSASVGDSLVTLSGSWPSGAPSDAYARLIAAIQTRGGKAFLDCTGKQLVEALKVTPFCVHLNQQEACEVFGTQTPVLSTHALAQHCTLAVVSDGARGAWFKSTDGAYHASLQVETMCSAVGSGDCMMAGVAAACARDATLDDIARLATACGAANCLRHELGMLNRVDVDRLLTKCKVEKLS
ncbi:MAG: 1-phosphofructokinase family hexose kinase [Verrucomicrobia bacterium]|nr:1-phosphofructokinase family hexose kinase [Verrucomicrobiota bacterium]